MEALEGLDEGDNVVGKDKAIPAKRNRVKGPNPLSVKKKKKGEEKKVVEAATVAVKKSRRKRGKGLVKQVREEMQEEANTAAVTE